MITDNKFNELKVESALANSFVIYNDFNNSSWVVFGNNLVDIITFKTMLLWTLTEHNIYMRNINLRKDHIEFLKEINKHDTELQKQQNFGILNFLYRKFSKLIKDSSKKDIINRYKNYIHT